MIWIKTQNGDLLECSAIKTKKISEIQYRMTNQDNEILGEYSTLKDTQDIVNRIHSLIIYNGVMYFEMPERKIPGKIKQ